MQEDLTDFEAKAQQVGAIVLTPLGGAPGPAWNASDYPGLPDDVGFIRDLITSVESTACIDPTRVFAMGMSNGSEMTSQLACSLADEVAAFAAVSGLAFPPGCHPTRAVPIIAFHGTADPDLAFEGGVGLAGKKLLAGLTGPKAITARAILALNLAPVPAIAVRWATTVDGCGAQPLVVHVSAHVERRTFTGCRRGSTVVLYVIAGGGHTWPGSAFSAKVSSLLGPTTMEIDANDLIWSFFQRHPLLAALVRTPDRSSTASGSACGSACRTTTGAPRWIRRAPRRGRPWLHGDRPCRKGGRDGLPRGQAWVAAVTRATVAGGSATCTTTRAYFWSANSTATAVVDLATIQSSRTPLRRYVPAQITPGM